MSRTRTLLSSVLVCAALVVGCGDDSEDCECDDRADVGADVDADIREADSAFDGADDPAEDPGEDVADSGEDGADSDGRDTAPPTMVCNDGILHTAEECEGFDLRGFRCEDLGFTGGRLGCADDCTYDTSACTECGDDVAGADEACDGADVRGAVCSDWLGEGAIGEVACADDCRTLLIDGCSDPAPGSALDACDPDADDACEGVLSCVTTSAGPYCLEACESDRQCDGGDTCRDQGEGEGACVPRPTLGERCTADVGCGDESTCVEAFDGASICAEACTPSDRLGCDAGTSCVYPPGAPVEVGASCSPAGGGCDFEAGFECVAEPGTESFVCVRAIGVCAAPRGFYQFEGFGPADDVLCDLEGPTAGGRFCTDAPGESFAMCYPVFGQDTAFGACVALCDDGAFGRTDRDCGEGWTCAVPDAPELFHPDPDGTDCSSTGDDGCSASYPSCIDFGDGPVCARASRICVEEGA